MATPDAGIESQLRNIEATYGRSRQEWYDIIRKSGKTKHNEVLAMLKGDYGLAHGAAHRLSLTARTQADPLPDAGDLVDELYAGKRAALRPIHEALTQALAEFDDTYEPVPKRGYVSLRRERQFAMIQPSTATRVDLGLILPDEPETSRLESAEKFNRLFTHRVRLASPDDVDDEVIDWLRAAYERASG
jgi:Domain of unknown function (DUF5655)/Domain of unknown function (DUF4287)